MRKKNKRLGFFVCFLMGKAKEKKKAQISGISYKDSKTESDTVILNDSICLQHVRFCRKYMKSICYLAVLSAV